MVGTLGDLRPECWTGVRAGSGDIGIMQPKEVEKLSSKWIKFQMARGCKGKAED